MKLRCPATPTYLKSGTYCRANGLGDCMYMKLIEHKHSFQFPQHLWSVFEHLGERKRWDPFKSRDAQGGLIYFCGLQIFLLNVSQYHGQGKEDKFWQASDSINLVQIRYGKQLPHWLLQTTAQFLPVCNSNWKKYRNCHCLPASEYVIYLASTLTYSWHAKQDSLSKVRTTNWKICSESIT